LRKPLWLPKADHTHKVSDKDPLPGKSGGVGEGRTSLAGRPRKGPKKCLFHRRERADAAGKAKRNRNPMAQKIEANQGDFGH